MLQVLLLLQFPKLELLQFLLQSLMQHQQCHPLVLVISLALHQGLLQSLHQWHDYDPARTVSTSSTSEVYEYKVALVFN